MKYVVLTTAILAVLAFFVGLGGSFSAMGAGVLSVSKELGDTSNSTSEAMNGYTSIAVTAHVVFGILLVLGGISIYALSKNKIGYSGAVLVTIAGLAYQIPFLGIPAAILVIIGGIILFGKWKKIPS